MKIPKDTCCDEPMDTWHNSIWCNTKNGIIRAQLYKCRECGNKHHREITWDPQYSDIIDG